MASDTQAFQDAFHTALVDWQQANEPDLPMFYENGPEPDQARVGDTFVMSEIRWYGASYITVGSNPVTRDSGALSLNVYFRSGEGSARASELIDSLRRLFKARRLGHATLMASQRTVPVWVGGWYRTGLLVPFELNSND